MSTFLSPVEIAKRICVMQGDINYTRIARVLTAVGSAADDVYQHGIPQIKSEFVRISDNLTAPLPCGAAKVLKVGILNNYGQIIHLYEDGRLRRGKYNQLLKKAQSCEADAADIANSIITEPVGAQYTPWDYFHNCSNWAGHYGEMYGYRFDPATIGTWRAVEHQGIIEFGTGAFVSAGRWVIIEYKDTGDGRLACIPQAAFAAIEARTRYYLGAGAAGGRIGNQDFQREYRQFKRLMLRKPIEEYLRGIGDLHPSPSMFVGASGLSLPSSSSSTTTIITTTPTLLYFTGDDEAIASGLVHGSQYLLADDNDYDLPNGLLKTVYDP